MPQPTKRPQSDIIDTLHALLLNIAWNEFESAERDLYYLYDHSLEMTQGEKRTIIACARSLVKEWYGTPDTEVASTE